MVRPIQGRLRVSSENPRYFTDDSGEAIYLTGSHNWLAMTDMWLEGDEPHRMNYEGYLEMMREHGHNFMRFWQFAMQPKGAPWCERETVFDPLPFARTGDGLAADGEPKFDLTRKNPAYFQRLRQRVKLAGDMGIYCAVMLFEAWALQWSVPEHNCWDYHPFNGRNNSNGCDDDPCLPDGRAWKVFSLECPKILEVQKRFAGWLAEDLSDMDNVLWEVCNEMPDTDYSLRWQEEICAFLKQKERELGTPHPVGITAAGGNSLLEDYLNTGADWTTPGGGRKFEYRYNPPPTDGKMVVFSDTDHLWGHGGETGWIWKSFTRGYNVIFMDPWEPVPGNYAWGGEGMTSYNSRYYYVWDELRRGMGYTRHYAQRMDLNYCVPEPELCTSTFCLANRGLEYLCFYPAGGTEGLDLWDAKGEFQVEWLEARSGKRFIGENIRGGDRYALKAPFEGPAVLYVFPASREKFAQGPLYKLPY